MSPTRSPLSNWICDGLREHPEEADETEPVHSSREVPRSTAPASAPPPRSSLEALSRREPIEPPPSSILPLGYRQSRSSGARVMLGITQNPWKKRA